MSMLNQEDLKQIGNVMDGKFEAFGKVMDGKLKTLKTEIVEEVGEMLEFNVLPQFDKVNERLDKLETTVATLPNKEYIDDKMGGLRAEFNLAQRGAAV